MESCGELLQHRLASPATFPVSELVMRWEPDDFFEKMCGSAMAKFERVAELDEIPSLGRKELLLDDEISALLLRVDDAYYCIEDICSHDGQPLTTGEFTGREVICPRHGAKFDVSTGKATAMPARRPIRVFPVEIRADGIYVQSDE